MGSNLDEIGLVLPQERGRRPRVAIIGTRGYPSYYGGFETLIRKLAPYLVEAGWDVTVYGRPGTTRPDDALRDDRVRSIITPGLETKSLSTLSYGLTSAGHALFRRPDVALIMNVANGYWLPLLKARGIPTVINVDGIEWDRAKWGRLAKAVFKNGAKMTARFADTLVYDAKALEDRWARDFKRSGVVISYGGDIPGPLPVVEGLQHRKYALIVARFVPENTVSEFFDAVPALSEKADVVIVGSSGYGGDLDQRAQALAQSYPRVHWLGHLSDDAKLFSLWQHAGAYFHGHSVGGTNPALVQAMACGSPTVARDTVFNREVLGDRGVFCQPTARGIEDEVTRVLADAHEQRRLSLEALRRVRSQYLWPSICESYEATLLGSIANFGADVFVDIHDPEASLAQVAGEAVPQDADDSPDVAFKSFQSSGTSHYY